MHPFVVLNHVVDLIGVWHVWKGSRLNKVAQGDDASPKGRCKSFCLVAEFWSSWAESVARYLCATRLLCCLLNFPFLLTCSSGQRDFRLNCLKNASISFLWVSERLLLADHNHPGCILVAERTPGQSRPRGKALLHNDPLCVFLCCM